MKSKWLKNLVYCYFGLFWLVSNNCFADIQTDSNTVFDWAEKQYSSVLAPPTSTKVISNADSSWYYRYYAAKDLYIGVNQSSQLYLYDGQSKTLSYISELSAMLELISSSANTATIICNNHLAAFSKVLELVDIGCSGDSLSIHSANGLPALKDSSGDDTIMVGITAWINRVPIPYDYNWLIPASPNWQNQITEASAKGPIAVAINGVPIFHYERRPDVSTALANYTYENDTVVQGELDRCGGHSGQGDDYHYHYTPVCLLDEHDLSQPIAFGLDGAPVYYGQGGTDYYGQGKYNNWNNFPDGLSAASLDECNAYQKTDGSYVHFTTKNAPYVIGCHHGVFDSSLQIEPRPMSGREQGVSSPLGGQFGEPVSTVINSFSMSDNGSYQMDFNALEGKSGTSSVIYRKSETSDSCWEFEFREDSDQVGVVQTACRDNALAVPRGKVSAIHTHTH